MILQRFSRRRRRLVACLLMVELGLVLWPATIGLMVITGALA
jgi:hypothetical protein